MYDDDYATCLRTYATLCVYPEGIDPTEITKRLGLEPSTWQRRGELSRRTDGGPPSLAPLDGWFLSSKDRVDSRDSRRHLDWLLDRLKPQSDVLLRLQDQGCRMTVSCYWLSRYGHGGPTLPSLQMKRLADLNLELLFDFYDAGEDLPDSVDS